MKIIKHATILFCMVILLSMKNYVIADEILPTESIETTLEVTDSEETTPKPIIYEQNTDLEAKIILTLYDYSGNVWMIMYPRKGCYGQGLPKGPAPSDSMFCYWEYQKDGEMVKVTDDTIFYEDTDLYPHCQLMIDPNYADYLKSVEEGRKRSEIEEKLKTLKSYSRWICYKKPEISSVKNTQKRTIAIKAFLNYNHISGYEIQYATSKKFKKARKIVVSSTKKKLTKKIKKLKKNKTYYIRVRAYSVYDPSKYVSDASSKTYYSKWSKAKKIQISK